MTLYGTVIIGWTTHLPPKLQLAHEAWIWLRSGPALTNAVQCAFDGFFCRLATPLGRHRRFYELLATEAMRILVQEIGNYAAHRAGFAHRTVNIDAGLG
ncbi:hypothetical protein RRF57_004946 [Xylaria bambusicola]|uniref:Uncharacterized protein n=1 Tax=Xylaria bambusicola TaxID=326684 RepID=A0AAN7UPN5_9PEZI